LLSEGNSDLWTFHSFFVILPDVQGLAVFCVVPTTLSSGVTMVTQAKAAAQTKRSHEDTKGPAISSADRASFP